MTDPTLIWVDLETTGLERGCHVLEIAAVATDFDLRQLDVTVFERVCFYDVFAPDQRLVDPFVLDMHRNNGLWLEARKSRTTEASAWTDFTRWLDSVVTPGNFAFAGSGVAAFDVPTIDSRSVWARESRLYWSMDVSPVRRLLGPVMGDIGSPVKAHRAMPDVLDSLDQARFVRSAVANWRDAAVNAMEQV